MGPEVAPIGALIEEIRFADDSPVERTGFELAVPLRWTALRSEVVEEAFGSARYDERGRPATACGVSLCYSVSHSMRPTAHSGRAGCGGPCPKVDVYQRR